MQPIRQFEQRLAEFASPEHNLFTTADLQAIHPSSSDPAVLLSRAVKAGILKRLCRGIYLNPRAFSPHGRLLFHVAAMLRANAFNYISLETALSDASIISQIPLDRITLMSSGCTNTIFCGEFGRIEFVHSARHPNDVADQLIYDSACRLWRATPALALRDMRATRRNLDLIHPEVIHELV